MKCMSAFILLIVGLTLIAPPWQPRAAGQWYHNGSIFYKHLDYGWEHHGSFNISVCSRDLMNCWEHIEPQIICHHWTELGTICDLDREYCSWNGYTTNWTHRWWIRQNACLYWWADEHVSRRARARAALRRRRAAYVRAHGGHTFLFVPAAP